MVQIAVSGGDSRGVLGSKTAAYATFGGTPPQSGGGGGTLDTSVKIAETSGSAQTNVPFEFGLPLAPGWLAPSQSVQVLDGATVLVTQEDNRTTDRNSDMRFVKVTGILPSLAANDQKILTIKAFSAPPPAAGNPVMTVAEILAKCTDFDSKVTWVDSTGTYIAKARDALQASTTWDLAQSHLRPGFWRDGRLCKEVICSAPLMEGANQHTYLRVQFHVAFFSVDNFATVTRVRCDCVIENVWYHGQATRNSVFGDCKFETGVAAPALNKQYADKTPSTAVTIGVGQLTGATPGTFVVTDVGKHIEGPSGFRAVITGFSGDGSSCTILQTAGAVGGSMASGTWTVHGLRVYIETSCFERTWWGTEAAFEMRHHSDDYHNSKMWLNFATPSNLINNFGNFGGLDAQYIKGLGFLDNIGGVNGNPMRRTNSELGEYYDIQQNEPDSQPTAMPQYVALRKVENDIGPYLDTTSVRRIMENGHLWANMKRYQFRDGNTGLVPDWDAYLTFTFHSNQINQNLPTPIYDGNPGAPPNQNVQHRAMFYYHPYLLTGDFRWLERLQMEAYFHSKNTTSGGQGVNKLYWDHLVDLRGRFWTDLKLVQHYALIPDNLPAGMLGLTKVRAGLYHENNWTWAKERMIDDGSGQPGWFYDADPGPPAPCNTIGEPWWITFRNSEMATAGFQFNYASQVYCCLKEMGQFTADGEALYQGALSRSVELLANPELLAIPPDPESRRQINVYAKTNGRVAQDFALGQTDVTWTHYGNELLTGQNFNIAWWYWTLIIIDDNGWYDAHDAARCDEARAWLVDYLTTQGRILSAGNPAVPTEPVHEKYKAFFYGYRNPP